MIVVVLSVDVRIFKIDVNFFNIIVVMRNFGYISQTVIDAFKPLWQVYSNLRSCDMNVQFIY
jgi:hypothetical protein